MRYKIFVSFFLSLLLMSFPVYATDYYVSDYFGDGSYTVMPDDGVSLFSAETVYPASSSNGQTYLSGVLYGYSPFDDYVLARVGQYEYVLWVGGDISVSGNVFTIDGAERYTYTYVSGSYYDDRVSVSLSSGVSDTVNYDGNSRANCYSSLSGFSDLRGGDRYEVYSLFAFGILCLSALLLPLYFYLGRGLTRR